jgi:hypothetical protein
VESGCEVHALSLCAARETARFSRHRFTWANMPLLATIRSCSIQQVELLYRPFV